jgi:hypothetical protein
MQRYTIFFITVNALRVSGAFSAHHQELKNCTHSIWYVSGWLAATASVDELKLFCTHPKTHTNQFQLKHESGSSNQAWHIPHVVCTVLELLMMGGETARNMYSILLLQALQLQFFEYFGLLNI